MTGGNEGNLAGTAAARGSKAAACLDGRELKVNAAAADGSAAGGSAVTAELKANAANVEPYVIDKRRYFHAHPELSGHEVGTARYLAAELDALGVEYRRVAETGIIATIRGGALDAYDAQGRPRKCIALRADIDALPVAELTGVPFASQNEGVMHACGHDCHMAMMLGTIRLLLSIRQQLRGEVRIIFQPEEEISIGSRKMIEAGVLEGVDTIFASHIWSEVDAGTVSVEPGPRMANCDWFRVDIAGSGAHGAMPHKGIDAVVVGAAVVEALQVVVSRDVSPFDPAVITVGEFHAGTARNVLAGSAYLTGTVRSFTPEVRSYLKDRMAHIVEETAASFGASAKFTWEFGNSCLVNDAECAARAQASVAKVLGEQALSYYEGTLSGEDFSEYLALVPGALAFVGTRNREAGASFPQHSCYYTVDESVLIGGSLVAAQYAYDFLAEG